LYFVPNTILQEAQLQRLRNKQKLAPLNAAEKVELASLQKKLSAKGVNVPRPLKQRVNGPGKPMQRVQTNSQQEYNLENRLMSAGGTRTAPGTNAVWANLGNTKEGRDWAMAALDPCGDITTCSGLPDTICAATATPVYRGEYNIAFDPTMFTTAPSDSTTYTVQLIVPPIPEISFMYRLQDERTGVWSKVRVVRLAGFENSTVNDQSGTTLRSIGYGKHRTIAQGLTLELNASELANQGRIVSGQIEGVVDTIQATAIAGPASLTDADLSFPVPYEYTLMQLPNSVQYLLNSCPKAYQCEAKMGAYIVSRLENPLKGYDFARTGAFTFRYLPAAASGTSQQSVPLSFLAAAFADSPNPYDDDTVMNTSFTVDSYWNTGNFTKPALDFSFDQIHPYVSAPSGMMTSVTFIQGLVCGATSTASVTGATLRIKTRQFIECISGGSPAIGPFITPSPLFDEKAINSVVMISQMGMDAYPASYNGLGDILGTIWSGIKRIGKPILSAAEFIPGLGTIPKWLNAGIDLADTLIPQGFAV